MNENSNKRREWIKTAAIVFLSVLLVLTFFSSTIMNYSLPEVATRYVEPGTITAKIRGTGMVESSDPYEVRVKETRKVTSVAVRQGDTVQKGDVLVYLEDTESEELKAARKALEAAQDAYDMALLSADVNSNVIQNLGGKVSTTTYRQQITNAQKKVAELEKVRDTLTAQIGGTPGNVANKADEQKAFDEAKAAKEKADFALTAKENALTAALSTQTTLAAQIAHVQESVSSGDAEQQEKLEELQTAKDNIDDLVLSAQAEKDSAASTAATAQLLYDITKTALDNKVASGDTTETIAYLNTKKNQVQLELDAANKELTDLIGNINSTLNLDSLYKKIVEARETLTEQEEKAIGGTVTADIAGTISTINATAGKEISAMEPVAIIQPEGKGYTLQFSVSNEQAKRLSVGDVADLVNAWRYDYLEVTLASIKPDPQNPGQQKQLTFNIVGNIAAGQSLSLSVGQKSANYDLIVPNSAIREDNNGKFILIVETKSTPLNNRYIASRVDVEVIASDDTRSAISGALYGYEYVITTSTAPVEAGKQVRLADN